MDQYQRTLHEQRVTQLKFEMRNATDAVCRAARALGQAELLGRSNSELDEQLEACIREQRQLVDRLRAEPRELVRRDARAVASG
jgi:hypothetical protein